ncbi:biopolymer transporter ExbD [Polyangium aurulentum]|uniref:biopolymer transporter ExbD n=1 Tax=Polyangium aurulentum TaxID=2567896 RepID=UPI001F36679C|nr:biopolymer transporter ExbD [Polyangium aurulentum]
MAGELNIVPYLDIITNVMMFVLASVSVTFIASVDTTPPAIGGSKGRNDVATKALNLSAYITTQGISLKTSYGNIAPGCQGAGPGITVPGREDEVEIDEGAGKRRERKVVYDYQALTACAKQLKNARPEFKEETQVTINANPGVDYGTIIETMDALRKDGEEELFPDVHFGVSR